MLSFGKFILFFALAVIIVIFSAFPRSAPIVTDLTLQDVMGTLGGVFTIVLLVERATEIIISTWRQADTDQKKEELLLLKDAAAKPDKAVAKARLTKFQKETKEIALLIGFTLAVIVCSSGVGLLGEIIDIPDENKSLLRGIDIILTSSLIAGGSDAFHQFVRALETFFTKSKENIQNS